MNLHFTGIGDNAMQSLAIALKRKEYQINGSDETIPDRLSTGLEKLQLYPENLGWYPEKINATLDAVILGRQVKKDNPELIRAEELGLKVYTVPEFLFELSRNKTRVVIAGSQGKTTITAMVLHVMEYHGKDVDYMYKTTDSDSDFVLNLTETNDFIVFEGEESFASVIDQRSQFQFYQPNIALLSGISEIIPEDISSSEDSVEQFEIFINSIVNGGILVYNEEDETVRELAENTENPIRKHPYSAPEYHVEDETFILDTPEGEMPLEISGADNMSNLAGAKWICQYMGIDEDDFYEAIIDFKQVEV